MTISVLNLVLAVLVLTTSLIAIIRGLNCYKHNKQIEKENYEEFRQWYFDEYSVSSNISGACLIISCLSIIAFLVYLCIHVIPWSKVIIII